MTNIGIGLDIGANSAKVVVGQTKKDFFIPLKVGLLKRPENGPYDLASFLNGMGIKGGAVLGVTGKEMIIRYTQVPPMPNWQLKQVMGFEIDDLATQSGGDLAADYNRLDITSSLSDDDTILLTLIKNSLLEDYLALLEGSRVRAAGFTPNSIALFNLLSRTADVQNGTSLIMGIGAENIDVAIVQEGAIIFARNLTGGSNLFNRALMDSFNIRAAKAETVKKDLGCIITRNRTEGLSAQEEKIGRSLSAPAGQIYSMIQSSLLFCKAQIKVADLSPDRVFLTGGGARIKGLTDYLADNLAVPVTLYDPAEELDVSKLENPADFIGKGHEFSSALGLSLMSATPDHYAIHVLPEAVKKRQRFQTRTVFSLLAAVLLVVFLGVKFYLAQADASLLEKDRRTMQNELGKRQRKVDEILELTAENQRLISKVTLLNEKIIPTTGILRTFTLIQKYLPDDMWIESVEIVEEEREEFGAGRKKMPVIKVQGSGREMGQDLQKSFTEFRTKLDLDPLTSHVIPQVRYSEPFTFTLLINFSIFPEDQAEEEKGGEEEEEA
jgi:type IV pilus assembly protein PilM